MKTKYFFINQKVKVSFLNLTFEKFWAKIKQTQVTKTLVYLKHHRWVDLHLQYIENDMICLRALFHK